LRRIGRMVPRRRKAKVRFASCGGAVCGSITWLKDRTGAGKVRSARVLRHEAFGRQRLAGSAFNPEDGKDYSGKMTLAGDHLTTAGCVLGGLICKSVEWTRSK